MIYLEPARPKHLCKSRCRRYCKILILAFVLLTSGTGHVAAQNGPSQGSRTIRGLVVNSVTREPISRALVFSSDNRFAVLTDSQGNFELSIASPAEASSSPGGFGAGAANFAFYASLRARKPGFLNDQSARDISSAEPAKEVVLELVPEALITGKVVLPSSEPPDSIDLVLYRRQAQNGRGHWVFAGVVHSRSSGEFRFAELAAGTYKLFSRESLDRDPLTTVPGGPLYGYPPVYFPGARDFATASEIHVAAGTTFHADLKLTRQRYYNVKVPVKSDTPTGSVNVAVLAQGRPGPGFELGYVYEDSAIEGMLPNGNYTLEVANLLPPPASGSVTITIHDGPANGTPVVLAQPRPIEVRVKEEFTGPDTTNVSSTWLVSGRTFTLEGPRKYLGVSISTADGVSVGDAGSIRPPTRSGSEPLLLDIPQPGRYWVSLYPRRGYVASARSGDVDLLREPLVVGAGGATPPIEVTMRDDFAQLEGTVEGKKAAIYCLPLPDSAGQFMESSSSDGTFGIASLAPGTYRILAFKNPRPELEYHNPDAMRDYESKAELVQLAAGQKAHVHLQVLSENE